MGRKYKLYQIDSFTRTKFRGNPAGVITNADGLSDGEMQQIARELNNSETAFIFSSTSEAYDVAVRFFTPTQEVPICGHATIAAHYARALEEKCPSGVIRQKTGAGILPVEIIQEADDYRIVMTQGAICFEDKVTSPYKEKLLVALGLEPCDLLENHEIQVASTGHSKLMVGIKTLEKLNQLKPNEDMLITLSHALNCNGYYVYTMTPQDSEGLVHGRMFAPAIGIKEDPVTGNANGPLGAYLVHYHLVPHEGDVFKFNAIQGEAINRMGKIAVEVLIEDNQPKTVKISGQAVVVFQSEIEL